MFNISIEKKILKNKSLIDSSVNEIRELINKREPESFVRYSKDVINYGYFEKEYREYTSFSNSVIKIMKEKGMTPSELYKKAHIDRKLFSKLKTDYCYQPNKNTAIKFCFALELPEKEATDLLNKAGFALKKWDSFDLAISYCIKNKISDIDIVNEILKQLDEKTI